MYTSSSAVFAVTHQARALCPQKGSKERHRFLVGTCSLHDSNELSVLEYNEDSNSINSAASYAHPDQIWGIEASPSDSSLVCTSWTNQSGNHGVSIIRMPHQQESDIESSEVGAYSNEVTTPDIVSKLNVSSSTVANRVKWHGQKESLLLADSKRVGVWDISNEESVKEVCHLDLVENSSLVSSFTSGAITWDPHTSAVCIAGFGSDLHVIDTRKVNVENRLAKAHKGAIRDVDYNPNKPFTFASCGDDRLVKIWDARNLKFPLKTLEGHSHWVWTLRFNPFHDQLIVSGGTDNAVSLWRVASCSSAPWLGSEPFSETPREASDSMAREESSAFNDDDPPDVKVRHMDQHEDSIYQVAWSPADAWIYCSLSIDGRIVVNHIPSTEKYKILL